MNEHVQERTGHDESRHVAVRILAPDAAGDLPCPVIAEDDEFAGVGGEDILFACRQSGEPSFRLGRFPTGQTRAFGVEDLHMVAQAGEYRAICGHGDTAGRP